MKSRHTATLSAILTALGCHAAQDADDARRRWLQDALIADNRDIMERDPSATAQKLAKMASSPYSFYRGTAPLFWADLTSPAAPALPTRSASPAAARVRLVGDPHPENLGTSRAEDGRILIDFNDYDASTWGPFYGDVRRLSMGFALIAAAAPDLLDAGAQVELAHATASAYAAEHARIARGEPTPPLLYPPGEGERDPRPLIADLVRRAARDGAAREELSDYTEVIEGRRRFALRVVEPPSPAGFKNDELIAATPEAQTALRAMWPAYVASLSGAFPAETLVIKDIAQRLGAGVSSYPLPRYYVLIEGPTSSPDDDRIVEAREVRDAPPLAGLNRPTMPRFAHNAARVVDAERALNAWPAADALLGHAALDTWSLRMRERAKHQKGVDVARIHDKLRAGEWRLSELLALADAAGRLLAQAHARGATLDGAPAHAAIWAVIEPDQAGFVEETTRGALDALALMLDDHARLRALIASEGALLGWRPAPAAPR